MNDPRAAEILLRWLQRPRVEERVGGVDLDSMSERELEHEVGALVRSLLAETEDEWLEASGLCSDTTCTWRAGLRT